MLECNVCGACLPKRPMQLAIRGLQVCFGKTQHKPGCPHAAASIQTTLSTRELPDAGGSMSISKGRLTLHVG